MAGNNQRVIAAIIFDSRSRVHSSAPTTISPISANSDGVIEPVSGALKASMARMKRMPDTWPITPSAGRSHHRRPG